MDFNHIEVEKKWKRYWEENETYKVTEDKSKPKYYILDMFPYPSGAGLHVGHPLGYIASDIVARYKKQCGYNVLHPMGFDAFGLPAEQYAIQTGVHPETSTEQNIKMYKAQLDNIGFNYDWSRQVNTSDPSYYKWTQWIFSELYNHYYCKDSNQAKPITELISSFEKYGNKEINAAHNQETLFDASAWKNMTDLQKDEVLMNYRLAYRKTGFVNWCEALGTVLANDEVKDGLSERGGHPVVRKAMRQWSLRITAYADRLLNDMQNLDWPEALKTMQANWIGRSEGAQVFFQIDGHQDTIEIFTTRPDTIFGATFMVLAPEHDLVSQLTTSLQKKEVDSCIEAVQNKSERERMAEVKEMRGAFTGSYCIHPFSGEKIPIWIGDYVLKDYGTGAIMAVPSDDDRDHTFALKYDLPIVTVVDKSAYPNASSHDKVGKLINSSFLNGLEVKEAISTVLEKIKEANIGNPQINYKLRDANFSRQRYWGEPFPIVYNEEGVSNLLTYDQLPLELPPLNDFKPTADGKSPLAKNKEWVETKGFTRETDTMPGFAGSSWYFLRYMDANNEERFASEESINYWKDVDFYIGGAEHAVGHLMYSRFWHKFLYDKGLVPTAEPFKKLVNQGMIQGVIEFIYLKKEEDGSNTFISADLVNDEDENLVKIPVHVDFVSEYGSSDSFLDQDGINKFIKWRPDYKDSKFIKSNDKIVTVSEVGKMSKRYFNVVNPDEVVEKYGADCFRMYEMFLGPIEQSKPWDTKGIDGVAKFLRRFWNLVHVQGELNISDNKSTPAELKILHTCIKKVTEDIERLSLNTAISAFMVCVNELKKISCNKKEIMIELTRLIAPFAPFMAEELWSKFEGTGSVHHSEYPKVNESFLVESSVVYPICFNGKKRDEMSFPADANPNEIENAVRSSSDLEKWMEGKEIRKVIVVPKRMVNIVI